MADGGAVSPEKEVLGLDSHYNFMPKGVREDYIPQYSEIFSRYIQQIRETDGFDIDIYPGDCEGTPYIPYLDFEEEADMLTELADKAIQDFNDRETTVYKYKIACIEKVNYRLATHRHFFMTVVADNLTLPEALETFQIHAYKGPDDENVVLLCRKKTLK